MSRRAARALATLAEQDLALGALSLWCEHTDGDSALAAESGDGRIVYGPAFEDLRPEEQVGLAGHHILHVALRHAARSREMRDRQGERFDANLFALAADAILNETLSRAGYALPRPAVLLSAVLKERLDRREDDPLGAWGVERLYLALQTGSEAQSGRSGEGFSADFQPEGEESDNGTAADWQQRVAQAMEAGRLAGVGVGTLGHTLAPLTEVRVPWEIRLRTRLLKAASDHPNRDFTRPSRRWMALADATHPEPPMDPGLSRRGRRARIGVGLDTSASIPDTTLARFAGEVAAIARRTGAEVHLLPFDTAVSDVHVLSATDADRAMRALKLRRGGGTDFRPVIAEAKACDVAILAILTDLEGPTGVRPDGLSVLWAATAPPTEAPPFGEILLLDR